MNNKRGGFGAKFLLVLFLMLIAAGGGAYGYSILDGKLAARDAAKYIERINISDYDTDEANVMNGYITNASKDLETAKTRKEVYEILDDFKSDSSKVMTRTEKELEEARRAVEEAKKNNNNYNSNSNNSGSYNNDNNYNSNDNSGYDNSGNSNNAGSGIVSGDNSNDSNKSSGGLFGNLFGSESDGDEYTDQDNNN